MKIALEQIKANPHRDFNLYPIIEEKITTLLNSIEKTGFWDNLMARPAGNMVDDVEDSDLPGWLADLDEAYDEEGNPLFEVELAYGHHRLEAAKRAGLDQIDIPVKALDDELMLQIMAEENHSTYAQNMNVIIETVRQAGNFLTGQIEECESFEDYVENGYTFFTSSKAMLNAKAKGIGFKMLQKFLGDSWPANDLRAATRVLKAVEDGVYEQEMITYMPSVGAMSRFHTLAENVVGTTWPEYFKDKFIKESSEIICDPKKGATVKGINAAASAVKKGKDPVQYLQKGKYVDFNLVKALKALVDEQENKIKFKDLKDIEGLSDYEGLDEALEEVKDLLKKDEEKAAKDGSPDVGGEAGAIPGDAQAEIDKAAAEAAEPATPPLPDVELPEEASVEGIAETFIQSAAVFSAQASHMQGKADQLTPETLERFGVQYENVFISMVKVGLEVYGRADLTKLIDTAEKTL